MVDSASLILTERSARALFGVAAIFLGVVMLRWQASHVIWGLFFATVTQPALAIAQIMAGVVLMTGRHTRSSSIPLIAVYVILTMATVPGIVAAPHIYATWGSLFERLALTCGAVALYANADSRAPSWAHPATRIGLGLCVTSYAIEQAIYFQPTAALVPRWMPPNQTFWTILTTAAFALAGLAALINRRSRLALQLVALMLGLFGILIWIPLLINRPDSYRHWAEFAETYLIAASALVVARLNCNGPKNDR